MVIAFDLFDVVTPGVVLIAASVGIAWGFAKLQEWQDLRRAEIAKREGIAL